MQAQLTFIECLLHDSVLSPYFTDKETEAERGRRCSQGYRAN